MVGGWIAGEVFAQALRNCRGARDRWWFMKCIFNQRRYLVDDLVFGDYGGDCNSMAESQGAVCNCNQGGNAVYMKKYVEDYRAQVASEGFMTFQAVRLSRFNDKCAAGVAWGDVSYE
ncbi:receptor-type adenylate cyclase [Trypanosoma rangeli]|uniref:Receptor-type adenylate cyclase n=1 Tax=Trypanosoma rangeli TaxID=5698 RepID=A0A3R7KEJ2_TRYRA|nr:receptor-type adenylate cyclase [Trypanosoma rangeli]RNE98878.1 receptor-type adenylate cyclase [Trypanosoma rangeli]|eukprot:RNE98878.1 receptor-type adenylate cyclase [Trypanosoma rangeli]